MAEHGCDPAAFAAASANLPPGWDCKFDERTCRFYYLNYFTKTTTWEDPRLRYRPVASPPQFFAPSSVQSSVAGEYIPLQDLTNVRPSPIPSRALSTLSHGHSSGHSSVICNQGFLHGSSPTRVPAPPASTCSSQETSLNIETEQAVTKIGTMFPTASETHIRTLLKKYHNREAVVISALQVEKHPITTPGPYSTPSMSRHHMSSSSNQYGIFNAYQQLLMSNSPPLRRYSPPRSPTTTTRPGSGASSSGSYGSPRTGEMIRASPRPHSSPKMKLRYMKGLYPAAEETLILDVLASADNNVQKASDKLKTMGFEKRDSPTPKEFLRRKEEEQKALIEKQRLAAIPTPPPRLKSTEEKQKMKKRLQELYPDIPERVVTIALDSSDFDEERARHILQVMVQEETDKPSSVDTSCSSKDGELHHDIKIAPQKGTDTLTLVESSPSRSRKNSPAKRMDKEKIPNHKRPKGKKDIPKVSRGTSTSEDKEYRSSYLQKNCGPNSKLTSGANNELLLVDYVTWQGPNPDNRLGTQMSLAKGPDLSLREGRYIPRGANKSLCVGPTKGLAKGSIYAGLNSASLESRGN